MDMTKDKIIELLKDYKKEDAEKFASYIIRLQNDKKKDGSLKNPWIQGRTEKEMADLFMRVAKDGLVFDGVHITLQITGISYDYIAYKNKMLLTYPETQIDVQLVYEGDDFQVSKESGSIMYHHNIANPLTQDAKKIEGGYCVIKNKRGEFLTLLSSDDIEKHRKVAKTDYIWLDWFKEMALKTVIKKAVKQHFADIYSNIEEIDNENYELENPLELPLATKQAIDAISTLEELSSYYKANSGQGDAFEKYITIRKRQLSE